MKTYWMANIIYIAILINPTKENQIIKPSIDLEKLTRWIKKEYPNLYFTFKEKESKKKQNRHILIQTYG